MVPPQIDSLPRPRILYVHCAPGAAGAERQTWGCRMKRPVYIDRPFYADQEVEPPKLLRGCLFALLFMLGVAAVVFGVVWGASRL